MNGMDVFNFVYRDRDYDEEGREMNVYFDLEDYVCYLLVFNIYIINFSRFILIFVILGFDMMWNL